MKRSYQVPKEVGRVGAESQTFIEPVAKRKDGIQAMFSRMRNSPRKRKRSPSPLTAPNSLETTLTADEDSSSSNKRKPGADEDKTTESVRRTLVPHTSV